jgi:hypothetical protein
LCKKLLGIVQDEKQIAVKEEVWEELLLRLTGVDMNICPCCGTGRMIRRNDLNPRCCVPLDKGNLTA